MPSTTVVANRDDLQVRICRQEVASGERAIGCVFFSSNDHNVNNSIFQRIAKLSVISAADNLHIGLRTYDIAQNVEQKPR